MASAVSIDSRDSEERASGITEFCTVSPSARVRKESFGLLFYSTRNATMTFVRSWNILQIVDSANGKKLAIVDFESVDSMKIGKLIDKLREKGLIIES